MLLFKRLVTSFILLLILWVVLCFGTIVVVAVIVGVRDATNNPKAKDFKSGYASGVAAGEKLGDTFDDIVLLSTLSISAVASFTISFGGVLPWCRKKSQPSALP
jgi:hypothetical protein